MKNAESTVKEESTYAATSVLGYDPYFRVSEYSSTISHDKEVGTHGEQVIAYGALIWT